MTTKFKTLLITVISFSSVVFFMAPAVVFAESQDRSSDDTCIILPTTNTTISNRLAANEAVLEKEQNDRVSQLLRLQSQRDQKLADARKQSDENITSQLEKLSSQVSSDRQKQAVDDFKQTILSALSDRRKATDAAQSTFRRGINGIVTDRKSKVDQIVKSFSSEVEDTVRKAGDDCGGKILSRTVRANSQGRIKIARDQFILEKQSLDKLQSSIDSLAKARNASIDKATSDFQLALNKAKSDLKSALGH